MQCVGNAEMIPQNVVQCGILVDPNDLADRNDRHGLIGKSNKKMFRDIHVLGGELRKRGKFFFCLC